MGMEGAWTALGRCWFTCRKKNWRSPILLTGWFTRHNILRGVLEIYQNKPFEIPTFETVTVSPEVLDKYVGVYSTPEENKRFLGQR